MTSAPDSLTDFDDWVIDNLLSVGVSVFTRTEVDHLLREAPRITARSLYYDILSAVSQGARTPAKIGGVIGRDNNAVRYPISVLESAGYLTRTHDLLRRGKPTISVCDPIIRFDRLIIAPHLGQLELGRIDPIWRTSAPTFRSNILGPHFAELARDWVHRSAPDELDRPTGFGQVGFGSVQDDRGRAKHDIDVLAAEGDHIRLIGEAKATLNRRGLPDLERLDAIREVLTRQGHDTAETTTALFSATGFTPDLVEEAASRPDTVLVDLERMYGLA
ncbi:hypothetical protein [Nonomuraea rhizosphaerae]|uniref:hypothetical protein n=1 Tax=Nonomuraea rhizosphaerae TaxID=2665663 RepID=UPI001C5EBB28|nr:hypothetical protein [Nonomuraea rhizosphaerae]